MNRKKKVIRNLIVLLLCLISFLYSFNLYLSPKQAHQDSEKGLHYGPSAIVFETNWEKGKYYLGRYENYISCDTILRRGPFWQPGSNSCGLEINQEEPITSAWNMFDGEYWIFYGIINDRGISSIEFAPESTDKTFTVDVFHDGMFLFHWKGSNQSSRYTLTAYDANGSVLYQLPTP